MIEQIRFADILTEKRRLEFYHSIPYITEMIILSH